MVTHAAATHSGQSRCRWSTVASQARGRRRRATARSDSPIQASVPTARIQKSSTNSKPSAEGEARPARPPRAQAAGRQHEPGDGERDDERRRPPARTRGRARRRTRRPPGSGAARDPTIPRTATAATSRIGRAPEGSRALRTSPTPTGCRGRGCCLGDTGPFRVRSRGSGPTSANKVRGVVGTPPSDPATRTSVRRPRSA